MLGRCLFQGIANTIVQCHPLYSCGVINLRTTELLYMLTASKHEPSSLPSHPRCGIQSFDRMLDETREPPLGAHIVTPRRGYTHHGIYAGGGRVVQYGGGLCRGRVEEVPLSRFARGALIWIRTRESGVKDRPEVVRRARSRLGEDRYHFWRNNCEHFCEWCVAGEHRSYQVDELASRLRNFSLKALTSFALLVDLRPATTIAGVTERTPHPPTSGSVTWPAGRSSARRSFIPEGAS